MFVLLSRNAGEVLARMFDDRGDPKHTTEVTDLASWVRKTELQRPRWVWDDTRRWYPQLLAEGVRVERCVDLHLIHAILRHSALTADSELACAEAGPWDVAAEPFEEPRDTDAALFDAALFDLALFDLGEDAPRAEPDPLAEWTLQRAAVAASGDPARIGLLLAAESAGALIACEMKHAGLPFHTAKHEALLEELLGARPRNAERPARLEQLKAEIVAALETDFNPDSPAELLKVLRRAGLRVESTRSWELKKVEHPAIGPLLEYKKLARLMTANGWSWLESWVADGRFRPEYVPGGVVTGRWAASGGGALQLPKQIRGAVVADPGWKLVVADAAQLEPRILAAMSADRKMAEAGRGDMYEGIVASGAVDTRAKAKIAMLGAMYGATTGESGRLLPALAKAFPSAIAMVEQAARAGERGEIVTTRLGRSSPPPGDEWRTVQGDASDEAATESDRRSARSQSRSWGRFTRNFIVQGTAAEWALCWMAGIRTRLWSHGDAPLTSQPHLVFFLHDEVIVHTPESMAEQVAADIRAAAVDAGRLLFGELPVYFPVVTATVDNYAEAK